MIAAIIASVNTVVAIVPLLLVCSQDMVRSDFGYAA
jgi:hypothetical protein